MIFHEYLFWITVQLLIDRIHWMRYRVSRSTRRFDRREKFSSSSSQIVVFWSKWYVFVIFTSISRCIAILSRRSISPRNESTFASESNADKYNRWCHTSSSTNNTISICDEPSRKENDSLRLFFFFFLSLSLSLPLSVFYFHFILSLLYIVFMCVCASDDSNNKTKATCPVMWRKTIRQMIHWQPFSLHDRFVGDGRFPIESESIVNEIRIIV